MSARSLSGSVRTRSDYSLHSDLHTSSPKSSLAKTPRRPSSAASVNTNASAGVPAIRLVTKDLIRDLVVPRVGQFHLTTVISPEKFDSLKNNSKILTKEERRAEVLNKIKEKDDLQQAARKRKEKFEELDNMRKQNERLNEMQEEAKQRTEYLRAKAEEARQEQEQEIKQINELLLRAKVQAIRDTQVIERQLIKNEYKKAELEMDALMEKKRLEGLQQEHEKARKRKSEAFETYRILRAQIQANEVSKLLEQERKDREGEEVLKKIQLLRCSDMQKMEESKVNRQKLLESLLKESELVRKRKEYEKEQSHTEDRWIKEYQKQKAAKEEATEAEIKEKRKQRELEIARMREQQEKATDLQAEKDALRARRAQEAKEKDWRQKEKDKVIKEKEIQEILKKARSDQLKLQDHLRILKAEKEQKDFDILLAKNNYELKLQKVQKAAKRTENLKYANEVREQIKEKEKERIRERKDYFKEGALLQQQEKRRNEHLNWIKRQKLNKLREYDIPDIYLKHVERKAQLTGKSS